MNTLPIKTLYIELTHACNQSCRFCYLDGGIHRKIEEMTTEEIKKIFKEFMEQGGKYAIITGGEALVRKDCFEILDYVDTLGIPFSFASNSLLTSQERLERLAGYRNLDIYFTSLLGSTKEKHERIAGNNSYDKVFKAIEFFDSRGIDTYVQVTLINDYVDDIPDIAELLFKYKRCTVKFTPASTLGGDRDRKENRELLVPKERFAYFLEQVNKVGEQYPGRIEGANIMDYDEVWNYLKEYQEEDYYALTYGFLAIRPDGTKSFSCNMNNPYTFGNAKNGLAVNVDESLLDYIEVLRAAEVSVLEKSRSNIVELDVETDQYILSYYRKVHTNRLVVKEVIGTGDRIQVAKDILDVLPEWFGIPESTAEYVRGSANNLMWGAYMNGNVIGFLSLKLHNEYTAEIYVMGVRKEYHRHGIGRVLFEEAYRWCKGNEIEFLQVKTVSELSDDCYYAATREYYKKMGFKPFESMPQLWDDTNPCLIMILSIK
ncbi:MAG TPA: GNAT family N-acetyltransferase [Lachnospiraceae bacterium]|nr:GNAT family N-acetyltransferase [Lachnospiraceae bacterium]